MTARRHPRPFLTARWEHLILLNFEAPDTVLEPLVPDGTVLERFENRTLVSLVGFRFRDTRVAGIPVPGHRDFEEVNLRFYVCRPGPHGEMRRAVVFIREIVPRRLVAWAARWMFNEPYATGAMRHAIDCDPERGGSIRYEWRYRGRRFALAAACRGPAAPLVRGSEAEFVTEHYWGCTRQPDEGTLEYRVEHPPWRVWTPESWSFEGPVGHLYGGELGDVLSRPPRSVVVAAGSAVEVHAGRRLV